jgi:hypothetical protein
MKFATHLPLQIQPASVCASLDGKVQAATFADLTGNVRIRILVYVTIPINFSASMGEIDALGLCNNTVLIRQLMRQEHDLTFNNK